MARLSMMWGLAGLIQAATVLAGGPGEGPVTWGNEQEGGHVTLKVPFSTPDRDRIEVVAAFRYTDPRLASREAMMRQWQASLPERVDVLRVPLVWKRGDSEPRSWAHRREHRQILLAARLTGIEDGVHAALVEALNDAPFGLGTKARVRRFLGGHGMDAPAYDALVSSPALRALWWEGSTLSGGLQGTGRDAGEVGGVPWMLVNGRHMTGSRHAGGAAAAFRVANRLIRETMESGPPFHAGPTNIPELIEKLEQWPGEHLTNARTGRFKGVYNPWRRELWSLDDAGEVQALAREVQGEKAFWEWFAIDENETSYAMNWRAGFYYVPLEPRVRHAAFLLVDWLSGGQVVELLFKRSPVGLSFAPDGTVEAQSAAGPVRGTWWLEAAALHVSLGEYGIDSWPWREAAAQVGFEVRPESVAPWRSGSAQRGERGVAEAG